MLNQLQNLPSISQVIDRYDLCPEKSLGQNFLLDTSITDQILINIPDIAGKTIIEVGPGPGCLTRSILAYNPKKLYTIETDPRCVKAMEVLQNIAPDVLEVVHADALQFDEVTMLQGEKAVVIANLPYNIGTLLVMKWLEKCTLFDAIAVMLQKEVVERFCAKTSDSNYGRISVLAQLYADCELLFEIEPEHFYPSPRVTSAILYMKLLAEPRFPHNRERLSSILSSAFNQRRKMLRTSLKGVLQGADVGALGIDLSKRAQDLTVEEYCKLSLL